MKTCEHCQTAGKYIAVEGFGDTRLFLSVSGEHLQIFDEEYPGRITNIKINNCPMCGRPLRAEEIIIKTNRVLRGLLLPIAPHVYFTQFVDDEKTEERERGLLCGLQLLRYCQLIRVYGCRVSAGMYNEIQLAGVLGIELEVYGPPEFVERMKEIYNNAAVTQKQPILRKKGRPAGVSAGAPAAAPLIREPDINPAAGAAHISINFEEDLARELEKEISAGNVLSGIMAGGA